LLGLVERFLFAFLREEEVLLGVVVAAGALGEAAQAFLVRLQLLSTLLEVVVALRAQQPVRGRLVGSRSEVSQPRLRLLVLLVRGAAVVERLQLGGAALGLRAGVVPSRLDGLVRLLHLRTHVVLIGRLLLDHVLVLLRVGRELRRLGGRLVERFGPFLVHRLAVAFGRLGLQLAVLVAGGRLAHHRVERVLSGAHHDRFVDLVLSVLWFAHCFTCLIRWFS